MNLADLFAEMRSTCIGGFGRAAQALRQSVFDRAKALCRGAEDNGDMSKAVSRWTEKISGASYKVVESDIDALREEGLSDLEIFELTVTASVAAADVVLARGLYSLGRGPG